MTNKIKLLIRKFLNRNGFEIVKYKNHLAAEDSTKWLSILGIDTILDIGANEGQFIQLISKVLPKAKIIAFEPLKGAFDTLKRNTKNIDVQFFNCALGDNNTTAEINVSQNSYSSSLLKIDGLTTEIFPESSYINSEQVEVKRLDDLLSIDEYKSKKVLTKIDVQGFEEQVIKGGEEIILNSRAILIEFAFYPLYENQWLFKDTYNYFTKNGFSFLGNTEQILSKKNGIPLYGDAIFVNNKYVDSLYM